METILVTGGAGAIGGNLCRELLARGYRVVVLDDLSSGRKDLVPEEALLIRGSVCSEADLAKVAEYRPIYVFHLAALFANQNSVHHPMKDLDTNGVGSLQILQWCVKQHIIKLLYTSSSCVYGNTPAMDENTPVLDFDTPYAITKYLGEKYCHFWSRHHQLDTVIVRLFNSYGPGEYPGRYRNVIPNFFYLAMKQKPLPITGTGEEIRDFNFVDDAVQGMIRAMFQTTQPGDVFNLGSGKGTRIREVAETINALTDNPAGIEYQPRRNWDNISRRVANTEKARQILAYVPQHSLNEGLKKTYAWFKTVALPASL